MIRASCGIQEDTKADQDHRIIEVTPGHHTEEDRHLLITDLGKDFILFVKLSLQLSTSTDLLANKIFVSLLAATCAILQQNLSFLIQIRPTIIKYKVINNYCHQ